MPRGPTESKRPDKQDRSWFSRWFPDTRTVTSQAISVAIHIVLLVTIAVWIAYAPARDQIIPAEVDVVEFEEPQQSEGPPDAPPDEVDLGPAQETEREVVDVTEPEVSDAPEIDLPKPEVPQDEQPPPNIDPDKWAEQLDALDAALSRLQKNVEQSGGGDGATGPNSRGAQQKRWTIAYSEEDCGVFLRVFKDIGMEEVGVTKGTAELVYVEPGSGRRRRGSLYSEARMHWRSTAGRVNECERAILRSAGIQPTHVIWFMARGQEQTLEELEAKYVAQHGLNIDDITRTVFEPKRVSGRWRLVVKSMR